MAKTLFITGTGTDVGKTYISGLLLQRLHAAGHKTAYFKAAMSGAETDARGEALPGDALYVKTFAGLDQPVAEMCPYVYAYPASPHLAARLDERPVEMAVVAQHYEALCAAYDYITVEGSGGIICPLRLDDQPLMLSDVVRNLNLRSLIVADAGLGAINHVALTAAYMQAQGLPVQGILLNRFQAGHIIHEDNRRTCEHLTGLPVVATVGTDDCSLAIDDAALLALYS